MRRAGRHADQPREIGSAMRRVVARLNQPHLLPGALRLRRQHVVRRQHAGVDARADVAHDGVGARERLLEHAHALRAVTSIQYARVGVEA